MRTRVGFSAARALGASSVAAAIAYLLLRPRERSVTPLAVPLEECFEPGEVARARAFERPQRRLASANAAASFALLALLARSDERQIAQRGGPATALDGVRLATALSAARLPLTALARRRALAAGIATQSWPGWTLDAARATAIEGTVAAAAGALLWLLQDRAGERWWQAAAPAALAAATLAAFAAPVLLDPLFNDFEPLPDGPLRRSVLELARRAGVRVREVYRVDASRRTNAVNAYVGGLGATRRIVLFDTLIERFGERQTELVVAHELAHVRRRDVARGLAFASLTAPAAAFAVARLAPALAPDGAGGLTLPAVAFAAALVGALTSPWGRALSRSVERRADAFALGLTGDPDAFVEFEREVTRTNLADPQPPRWRTLLFATHPPAVERIGAALALRRAP
ncbi:MAG TPA: M48 family metalloprotease [Solirubrobacteraceae bacterium]|nr:M48 family metalloprotease [Solirubrobacteraceae bacterium]